MLQHHIRLHLGGQIPPDEDMPTEDGAEIQNASFDDGENDSVDSPSDAQQLLPLALTTGSKSPMEALNLEATSKKSAASDANSVKTEESESSTPSVSPTLTHNPSSVGAEDPLRLGDNTQADGSPMNSEEETQADLGSTSPFKAPSTSSHSAVVNGDTEADDVPLSLCISKPVVEKVKVISDDPSLADEPTTSSDQKPKPTSQLTPPVSPKPSPEVEASVGVPPESQEKEAPQKKAKSESKAAREPLPVDPEPEKETPKEEGLPAPEKPSEDPEPSVPAPAPLSQPARPDKPYSCSQCGKTYASRSGLKVRDGDIIAPQSIYC